MSDVVGVGKLGAPAGDVLTVQGGPGGFPVPVTPTTEAPPSTSTVTAVAQNAASVTLAAANSNRKHLIIHNNTTAKLFYRFGAAASLVLFSDAIGPKGTVELEWPVSVQLISGIWDAAGAGDAMVTEELP